MTLAEARRIIWARLAVTAREDGDNVDWELESYGAPYDAHDVRRLERASEEVARMIERKLKK